MKSMMLLLAALLVLDASAARAASSVGPISCPFSIKPLAGSKTLVSVKVANPTRTLMQSSRCELSYRLLLNGKWVQKKEVRTFGLLASEVKVLEFRLPYKAALIADVKALAWLSCGCLSSR